MRPNRTTLQKILSRRQGRAACLHPKGSIGPGMANITVQCWDFDGLDISVFLVIMWVNTCTIFPVCAYTPASCTMFQVLAARVLHVAWCDFVEFEKVLRFRYASTCHSMWFQCQTMTSFWFRTSQHRAVRVQGRNLNQWQAVVIWMVEHHSASIGIHPSRLSDVQSRHSRVWGLDELPVRVVKADLDINAYTFISHYI